MVSYICSDCVTPKLAFMTENAASVNSHVLHDKACLLRITNCFEIFCHLKCNQDDKEKTHATVFLSRQSSNQLTGVLCGNTIP